MGSPVTTPTRQGCTLSHRPGDSPVDGVEAERRSLMDKSFSGAAIRTILAATRDTSRKVYNSRLEGFTSWYSERGQNLFSTSVKHVLDFLQLKSETLSVNSLKEATLL